jgi:hypothetical protein
MDGVPVASKTEIKSCAGGGVTDEKKHRVHEDIPGNVVDVIAYFLRCTRSLSIKSVALSFPLIPLPWVISYRLVWIESDSSAPILTTELFVFIIFRANQIQDPVERFVAVARYFLSGWHIKPKVRERTLHQG